MHSRKRGGARILSGRAPRFIPIALAFAALIGYALALALVPAAAQAQQDTTAPTVNIDPANGSTVTDREITLTFSEPVYSDTSSTRFSRARIRQLITLKLDGPAGEDLDITWLNMSNDNRVIRVLPLARDYLYGKKVYFAFSGDYYDASGNRGAAASSTFTVVAPPPPTKEVIVTPGSVTFIEGGLGGFLNVKLGVQPTATVTVAIIPSGGANASGSNCSSALKICIDTDPDPYLRTNKPLIFTTTNWNFLQYPYIGSYSDTDTHNERITLKFDPSGADYDSVATTTAAITVIDDDKKSVFPSAEILTMNEGSFITFTARLTQRPSTTTTLTLTSSNPDVTLNPASLTFTGATWNTAQIITVAAAADVDTRDETAYLTVKPSGADYTLTRNNDGTHSGARSFSVVVNIKDNGVSGLIVSTTSLSINESGSGNSDTFTVRLASNPSSTTTVAVGVHGPNGKRIATADKNILRFTPQNGTTSQTVTITGVADNDDSDDTGTIRVVASQNGPYSGLSHKIALSVNDTWKRPAILVSPEVMSIREGSSGAYSVSLASEPTGTVTARVGKSPYAPLTASPTELTFTRTNYATPQTLTLYASDIAGASERHYFDLRASGGGYDGVRSPSYGVNVTGTVAPKNIEVRLNGSALYQVSSGPGAVDAKVRLSAQPTGNVTVSASASPSGKVSLSIADSGVFSTSTWNSEKTLRITVLDDADTDDDLVVVTLTASGGGYAGVTRRFEVVSEDDDEPVNMTPPTATIGSLNQSNVVTVTFSKAVGWCSTKTATSAAETYCSGTVAPFTSATIADVFKVVVIGFDQDYDFSTSTPVNVGAPVTFTATISGNVATITPTGITQTGDDIPLVGNVRTINLLVRDRYWSVDGGVIGASVLKRLRVQ